ncbi:hypothetical protein AHAS_Ahas05G0115200 [Arachis hypogaea]
MFCVNVLWKNKSESVLDIVSDMAISGSDSCRYWIFKHQEIARAGTDGSRVVPPLSFSIISKIALLGVIGCSSQMLGYAGISYSNPTFLSYQ